MEKLTRCPSCKEQALEDVRQPVSRVVAEHTFTAKLPAQRCTACGEVYIDGPALGRVELEIAVRLAEAGETSGEAVRWMRKAMGLRSVELASLLDVRPETITRWEKERRAVDRPTLALLHQLLLERRRGERGTLAALERLQKKPKRLAKTVRVDERRDEENQDPRDRAFLFALKLLGGDGAEYVPLDSIIRATGIIESFAWPIAQRLAGAWGGPALIEYPGTSVLSYRLTAAGKAAVGAWTRHAA